MLEHDEPMLDVAPCYADIVLRIRAYISIIEGLDTWVHGAMVNVGVRAQAAACSSVS
jgi:hypothetical protein